MERIASSESLHWNQMPHRDKSDKFNKIGAGFSKILNSARNELSPNIDYKSRVKKLGEISESMTQFHHSKIQDNFDLTNR